MPEESNLSCRGVTSASGHILADRGSVSALGHYSDVGLGAPVGWEGDAGDVVAAPCSHTVLCLHA